jgi:hypothetical protein
MRRSALFRPNQLNRIVSNLREARLAACLMCNGADALQASTLLMFGGDKASLPAMRCSDRRRLRTARPQSIQTRRQLHLWAVVFQNALELIYSRSAYSVSNVMSKIYVGNLPFSADEEAVRTLFSQHGTVDSVALIMDRDTGRPRGFGFVEMPRTDAARAIQSLNGQDMGGRPLKVNEAQDKPRTGGGGGQRHG